MSCSTPGVRNALKYFGGYGRRTRGGDLVEATADLGQQKFRRTSTSSPAADGGVTVGL